MKVVLLVVAILVGVGVVVAGGIGIMAWRVSHSIKQARVRSERPGDAVVSMLGGTVSTGKNAVITDQDLGVPIYPGAVRGEGGIHMTLPTMSMSSAVFTANAPVGAVVAFYKGKLGENESDVETASGSVLSSGKESATGGGIVITVAPEPGGASGKTKISIVRTTSTAQ